MNQVYEALSSSETPIVFAKGKKDSLKVTAYTDGDLMIVSNAISHAYSPISGRPMNLVDKENYTELSSEDLTDMVELAECHCGAKLMTTPELASSFEDSHIHCVVCGREIELASDDEVEEEDIIVDDNTEVEDKDDEAKKDDADDKEEAKVEEPAESEKDDESEKEDESAEKPEEKDEDIKEEAKAEKSAESDKDEEENDENVSIEDDEEQDNAEECCVRFDLLKAVASFDNIELVKSNKGYNMLVNNSPVATVIKAKMKPELASLFDDSESLTKALSVAVKTDGMCKEVKASFGIQPMMVRVSTDEAARQQLEAVEASLQTKYEKKNAEFVERYKQSLAIASVGINKGIYGENILAKSFIKSLAASGIIDAEDVANEIFAKYGESYLKDVIAKASELVEKSDEVRNETASLVQSAPSNVKSRATSFTHKPVELVETTASVEKPKTNLNRYANLF